MGRVGRLFDWLVWGSTAALVAGVLAGVRGAEGAGSELPWTSAGDYLVQAGILGLVSVPVAELVLVARRFARRKQSSHAALTALLGILLGALAVASLLKGG